MAGKLLSPRVATALIGIPIVALIVAVGGPVFNLVVMLLALIALRELDVAARAKSTLLIGALAYPALVAIILAAWNLSHDGTLLRVPLPVVWIIPLALLVWAVLCYGSRSRVSLASVALTQLAILYVALFAFLIVLRARPT